MEENPRRHRHGTKYHSHKGAKRGHHHTHRNPPIGYQDMNNSYNWAETNPHLRPYENPNILENLNKGSAITQDVGVIDVVAGGISFGFNNWFVKNLDLKGAAAVLASAIVPVITGALASLVGQEKLGASIFLGGEIDAFAKVLGKLDTSHVLPIASEHESGDDWVLTSGTKLLQLSGPAAHAGQLVDHSFITNVDRVPQRVTTIR